MTAWGTVIFLEVEKRIGAFGTTTKPIHYGGPPRRSSGVLFKHRRLSRGGLGFVHYNDTGETKSINISHMCFNGAPPLHDTLFLEWINVLTDQTLQCLYIRLHFTI